MSSGNKIFFFYQGVSINIRERKKVKAFIHSIFKTEKRKLERLNFVFCTDKALLKVNQQYLKHDFYTDIITFDLSLDSQAVYGEIYISAERVRENAKKFKAPLYHETLRVMFHGVLHLCGY